MRWLALFLIFGCAAFSQQLTRVDPSSVTTIAGNAPVGGNPAVYAVPNALITVCNNNTNPCTSLALTYTDATGLTQCPTTAQVVLASTNACVSTAGKQGEFGFWMNPGLYYYVVTPPSSSFFPLQSYGPFPVTVGGIGAGVITYTPPWSGGVAIPVSAKLAESFSVDDFGASPNCFDPNNPIDSSPGIQAAIDYPSTLNAGNGLSRRIALNNSPISGNQIFGSYCISQPIVVEGLNMTFDGQFATLRPTYHGGPTILAEPPNPDNPVYTTSLLTGPGQSLTFNHGDARYINLSQIPQIVQGLGAVNYPNNPTGAPQFDVAFTINQTALIPNGSIIGSRAKRINSETDILSIEIKTDGSTGGTFNFAVDVNNIQYTSGNVGTVVLNTPQTVEVSYDGSNIRAFVAGNVIWTQAATGPWTVPTYADITIGTEMSHFPEGFTNFLPFTGSIDSIMFSDIARNTANYTPPTAKFTSDSDTVFLLNFDHTTNLAIAQNLIAANVDGGTGLAWLVFKNGTFENNSIGGQVIQNVGIDAAFSGARVGGVETIASSGAVVSRMFGSQLYWGISFENNSFYANTHNNVFSLASASTFTTCRVGIEISQNNDVDIDSDQVYTANCSPLAEAASNGVIRSLRAEGNFDGGIILNNDSGYFFWDIDNAQIQNETTSFYANPRPLGLLAVSGHTTVKVHGGIFALFNGSFVPITVNGGVQLSLNGVFIQMRQLALPASVIHFVTTPTYPVVIEASLKSGSITYLPEPSVPWSDNDAYVVLIQADGQTTLRTRYEFTPSATDVICAFGNDSTLPGGLTCNNSTDPTGGAFFNTQFVVPDNFFYAGADWRVTWGLNVFTSTHASFLYNAFFWGGHGDLTSNAGSFTQFPLNNINGAFGHGYSYELSFTITHPNAISSSSPLYTYTSGYTMVNQPGFGFFNAVAQPVMVNSSAFGGALQLLTQYLQDSVAGVTITAGGGPGCTGVITFSAPSGGLGVAATGSATVNGGGAVTSVIIATGGNIYNGNPPTINFAGCSVQPTYTVTLRGNPGNALQVTHMIVERIN